MFKSQTMHYSRLALDKSINSKKKKKTVFVFLFVGIIHDDVIIKVCQ